MRLKTSRIFDKTNYKEVDAFGWKVRDRINNAIEAMRKSKMVQNMSNKAKTALRNVISAKYTKIVINDIDKNTGAADADKVDVIVECVRQLSDVQTYLKITEETLKTS